MLTRVARSVTGRSAAIGRLVADEAVFFAACRRAGLLRADRPAVLAAALKQYRALGPLGAVFAFPVLRTPDRVAVIDDRGSTTFAELDRRANALANAWLAAGLRPGDGVGLMMRNHAGFVETMLACVKTGTRAILLNTEFSGPQLKEVAGREGVRLFVHDDEFGPIVAQADAPLGRYRAWVDEPAERGAPDTLDGLVAGGDPSSPPAPGRHASLIILTSGTTGTPKGAVREQPRSLSPFGGLLERVPLRANETTMVSTPAFHALGLLHVLIAVGLGTTQVMRRRFDAAQVGEDIERHGVTALIVVPVMLRRVLDAHDKAGRARDLSSLRIVFVAGSQLGGTLATRTQDTLGEVVYNLYGSTEVAMATIATPEHVRQAPDAVGPVVRGSRIRILDDEGRPVPQGTTGRVFVGNAMPFAGYTGGGTKELIDGLMSSGDVGHLDARGLLTIDGRDDDMIISGGENLFPGEVEELLVGHGEIAEVAVIGVADEEFGQRLRAFVVRRPGSTLGVEDVRTYAREHLARFKVPRDVLFLDELPRNPTGKVLKRKLQEVEG